MRRAAFLYFETRDGPAVPLRLSFHLGRMRPWRRMAARLTLETRDGPAVPMRNPGCRVAGPRSLGARDGLLALSRRPWRRVDGLRCLETRDGLAVPSARTIPVRSHLAFTRYCFTSMLLCTNQSSFYRPLRPALPALLQYCCTSIAQYTTPPRPPLVYSIQDTTLIITISCNGQGVTRKIFIYMTVCVFTHECVCDAYILHRRFIIQRGHEHTRTGN